METTETNQFLKQLVLNQLEQHLNGMFKTQVRNIWTEICKPKSPTVEEMRENILEELTNQSLEEISQFILHNPIKKPRGFNGGRKKKISDRFTLLDDYDENSSEILIAASEKQPTR